MLSVSNRYPYLFECLVAFRKIWDFFNPFELPPRLLGADNYTEGETPDLDLLNEAWERSPVSVMSSIEANTLIFVGKDDQRQGSEWTIQSYDL